MSSVRPLPIRLAVPGLIFLSAVAPASTHRATDTTPYPPHALILFVASWCAPCRAELRQVDAIVAAAGPFEVRITPIDRSGGTTAMLRGVPAARIWRSAHAVNAFAQSAGSLPFSMMTDANGRLCATHDRALDPATIVAMRHRCEGIF